MIRWFRHYLFRRTQARRERIRNWSIAAINRQDPEDAAVCRAINDRLRQMQRDDAAAACLGVAHATWAA